MALKFVLYTAGIYLFSLVSSVLLKVYREYGATMVQQDN